MTNDRDGSQARTAATPALNRQPGTSDAVAGARPTYAANFQCIGPACEDTCCRDWSIPVDKNTYQLYTQFPAGKLGSIVAKSVMVTPDSPDPLHARIDLAASGFCPFFTPDQLCGIQKEYGSRALSATCSIYPRTLNRVHGMLEGSLALSCPEAARNVLLAPDAVQQAGDLDAGTFRTDNAAHLGEQVPARPYKPYEAFYAVRDLLVEMVRDRSRPMWQRLLLIGSLCKRLEEIESAEQLAALPALLQDYRAGQHDAAVQQQLQSMPQDTRKKIDVILTLTNARVQERRSGKRFTDTFWSFIEGIGTEVGSATEQGCPGEEPATDIACYRKAEQQYYGPFFEQRPHVLENYLVNYMYQTLFPFGREGSQYFTRNSLFDEYILMATQFAWINGLLIGIAGRHGQAFAEVHVIEAVQSFCRAVEHFPYVLVSINDYVRSQKLDSLHGMSVLLR